VAAFVFSLGLFRPPGPCLRSLFLVTRAGFIPFLLVTPLLRSAFLFFCRQTRRRPARPAPHFPPGLQSSAANSPLRGTQESLRGTSGGSLLSRPLLLALGTRPAEIFLLPRRLSRPYVLLCPPGPAVFFQSFARLAFGGASLISQPHHPSYFEG